MPSTFQDNIDLHLLHGFLGRAEDWNNVFAHKWKGRVIPEDVFNTSSMVPFDQWAEKYNHAVAGSRAGNKKVLLGYSLGGRLGLHALIQQPHLWDAAIFVSSNPGIVSATERQQRLAADNVWADRFEIESWEPLIEAWNSQPVFRGDAYTFDRKESDFRRADLAKSFRVWSLGLQEPLYEKIGKLNKPILWMAGGADVKYAAIAKSILLKHPLSRICIMPGIGHRPHWQDPNGFLSKINEFIISLEQPKL